jgi:hypothetical protein
MKFCFPILWLCFLSLQSSGQGYYDRAVTFEAGISVGPMNSLTDIGGRRGNGERGPKDLNIKSTTLYGSLYGSAIYKHFLAIRLEATVGKVKSNDSLLRGIEKTAIGRFNRNLSFRSPIYEGSLTAELHPIELFSGVDPERYPPEWSPYVIGGVGYFHFNPQANLNGEWIDLQPLHTEGQDFAEYPERKNYKLNEFCIPLGVGVAYEVSPKFNLRLEYISRVSFTDYLDDVHSRYIDPALFSKYLSGADLEHALVLNNRGRPDAIPAQTTAHPGGIRGNPLNNDSYFTINFKIGYAFGRDSEGRGSGGGYNQPGYGGNGRSTDKKIKRQLECPRIF